MVAMAISAFISDPSLDRLRAGDGITLTYRGRVRQGVVVEDRGDIGVGGRQLVRVRVLLGDDEQPREFEMPAAEAERVS